MDYATAARLLPIDKHRLDDELESHAGIAAQVSVVIAAANTAQQRAKDHLARVEARCWATIKDTGEKLTAAEIEGRVVRNPARIDAFEAYLAARELYEQWLGMGESWKQRSYAISKLSELYCGNYFALTLNSTNSTPDDRPAWQRDPRNLPARRAAEVTEVTPSSAARRIPIIRRKAA